MCVGVCGLGCMPVFRGWGVLASQSNPNLAKFGGGWPVSIFVKLCVLILSARLVSLCGALQIVRCSNEVSGPGLATRSPGPRSYILLSEKEEPPSRPSPLPAVNESVQGE